MLCNFGSCLWFKVFLHNLISFVSLSSFAYWLAGIEFGCFILKLKRVGNTRIKVGRFCSMGGAVVGTKWRSQVQVLIIIYFYDLLCWFIHVSAVSLVLPPLWATMQQDSAALPRSPKIILSSLPEFPCCVRLRPGVVVCISNMRNDSEAFGDKQGTMRNDNLPCGSILTSSNKRNKQFQDKLFDARFIRSLLSRWELSETRVLSWIYTVLRWPGDPTAGPLFTGLERQGGILGVLAGSKSNRIPHPGWQWQMKVEGFHWDSLVRMSAAWWWVLLGRGLNPRIWSSIDHLLV